MNYHNDQGNLINMGKDTSLHFGSLRFILSAIILTFASGLGAMENDPPFLKFIHHHWVDSVFNSLSREEKIGQLILADARADNDIAQAVRLSNSIIKAGIGGIKFTGGKAVRMTEMINYFQDISTIPLLIAADCGPGPGLGLEGPERFPGWITLEAVQDDSLLYKIGNAAGKQFKRAGVSVIPDLTDINKDISLKIRMYRNSLQDFGIVTFPDQSSIFLKAGVDFNASAENTEDVIKEISERIKKGLISQADIDNKCRMVLAAKYWAGVSRKSKLKEDNLLNELSPPGTMAIIREAYARSLTVLINKENIVPVKDMSNLKIAAVTLNGNRFPVFQQRLLDYLPADTFSVWAQDEKRTGELIGKLSEYDLVIAGVSDSDRNLKKESGMMQVLDTFLDELPESVRTIITWFGNPENLDKSDVLMKADGLVLAYEDNDYTRDLAAQLIFGGIGASGTLPVSLSTDWPAGFGITTPGNLRLQYGLPENAGLSSEIMNRKIDSIAAIGLVAKAFPGCEIMVARKGIVVFHKTYGFHTYDNRISVRKDDLYDLASVTKVSSTLAGLMLLDSEGKFSVERKLGEYLPEFRRTNKGDLLMKDLMTHQAGLRAWIPFWMETVKADSSFKRRIFSHEYSEKYPLKVANDLYINKNYRKKIIKEIRKSPLGEKKFVYSDLTFIISTGIIDNLTGEKWYDFVTRNIYHKLGAFDICFNPYLKYPLPRIVPTEYDSLFRRQLLHGTVHDEGAAMLGGISGHAGLFATANDLMKLMELYRRMGEYGGEQIIDRKVLEEYTRVQFPENNNKRGLGFDKPPLNNQELGPAEAYPAKSATAQSFGHSGYTGTFVWIDPVYEISYIFLSNRVNPTRNNNLLSTLNIRPYILQAVYDSINDSRQTTHDTEH